MKKNTFFAASLIVILLLVGSVGTNASPLTAQERAQIVGSSAQHFWLNGEPFRFIGYNVRGFVHYGEGDILFWSQPQDRFLNAQVVQNTGGRVIRVFGSNRHISNEELGNRLEYALNVAHSYGFKILYAFTDYYFTGFNPKGDEKFYAPSGGYTLLNHAFFAGGYQENYLPQVVYLVNRFKDHPALFAWQLGNEIKHPADPTVFYNFCMHMHSVIRSIDQNHMISVGLISTWPHTGWNNQQATTIHSTFDFLTFHPYNGAESNEHEWANAVGRPLLIGEAGFSSGNRPQNTSNDIAKWVGRGARGYLQWGLMASPYDNGDGDRMFGVDQVFHPEDWSAYLQMFSSWAQQLANTTSPPAVTPKGVTATEGTHTDKVTVSWDFEPSAKEYAVFRSTTPGGTAAQVSPWSLTLSYDDTSAIPGITYYYSVKARNNGGQSDLSDQAVGWAAVSVFGSLAGFVYDQGSSPVQGAGIVLNPGQFAVESESDGSYSFNSIPPGNYSMTVLKAGYKPGFIPGIEVIEDQTVNVNVHLQTVDAMSQIKGIADGEPAAVSGVVTAIFPAGGQNMRVYVQSPDRSGGIAVITSASVSEEDELLVEGNMATIDGERVLNASAVYKTGAGTQVRPVGMTNRVLGGGAAGLQSAVMDNAQTDKLATGLNNVGILATAWGRVVYVSPDGSFFYMNDGSGIRDGSGHTGIRVSCVGLPTPSVNTNVSITGISGVTSVNGNVVRLLRPRTIADLSYIGQFQLINPGFETGTHEGWTEYGATDGVLSGSYWGGITAHSGQYFIGTASHWGIKNGGVYQRIQVPAGLNLQAKAWSRVYRLGNPANSAQNKVGIDPTGGTNPSAITVQWSPVDTQPADGFSEWKQLTTPTVQSNGGYVTIFLDMYHANSQEWKVNAFDDAELHVVLP